jgi:hypothetical protein
VKPTHGGYPDAKPKRRCHPIHLQIARASEEHDMWRRRFAAVSSLKAFDDRPPEFADRDGRWSMAELLNYMASACGFARTEGRE